MSVFVTAMVDVLSSVTTPWDHSCVDAVMVIFSTLTRSTVTVYPLIIIIKELLLIMLLLYVY